MNQLDLTPVDLSLNNRRSGRRRTVRNVATMGLISGALAVVLYQAVSSARVFFYTVDEAVERRDELDDRTFRMQGTIASEDGVDDNGALMFTVTFADARVEIRHVGDEPSSLFAVGESVVVEGRWHGHTFQSHQILVKHSEEYIEDNPDRLDPERDPSTPI